jgi:hypothetical protein
VLGAISNMKTESQYFRLDQRGRRGGCDQQGV